MKTLSGVLFECPKTKLEVLRLCEVYFWVKVFRVDTYT